MIGCINADACQSHSIPGISDRGVYVPDSALAIGPSVIILPKSRCFDENSDQFHVAAWVLVGAAVGAGIDSPVSKAVVSVGTG